MKSIPLYSYIKMYREVYGIKRTEFGSLMHLSACAYAHYERGRRRICFEDACAISHRLGIPVKLLESLPLVDIEAVKHKARLSEAELHAAFLHFHTKECSRLKYKYLSVDEKWWLFIYHACRGNKKELIQKLIQQQLLDCSPGRVY